MEKQLVVVGGGASGALLVTQLLRQGRDHLATVRLVEPAPAVGVGLAYRTDDLVHRLNVPAGRMSALPDDPEHLVHWAERRDPTVDAWSYLPRAWYRDYLADLLDEAEHDAGATELDVVRGAADRVQVVDPDRGFGLLWLTDGRCVPYDQLVVATGHAGPTPLAASPAATATGAVVDDPWAPGALQAAARRATASGELVVLVGTGLTMVDVALSLSHLAPGTALTALSRHGLVPQPHPRVRVARRPERLRFPTPVTARSLLRIVREAVDKAVSEGEDWTTIVDDLRPLTTPLWQQLSDEERVRFLRHVGRRWEVVRHRMAPDVGDEIARLEITGALALRSARVAGIDADGDTLEVSIRHAGETRVLRAAAVVNCTGPCGDVTRGGSPFLTRLVADGLAVPHPLGMGLAVDDDGALLDPTGRPSPALSAIGPLRRGHLFESTAIPEIRVQAADLARRLLELS